MQTLAIFMYKRAYITYHFFVQVCFVQDLRRHYMVITLSEQGRDFGVVKERGGLWDFDRDRKHMGLLGIGTLFILHIDILYLSKRTRNKRTEAHCSQLAT